MLTINSHGVELSIAGCLKEMVCDPNPMPFVYFYFYFVCFVLSTTGKKDRVER